MSWNEDTGGMLIKFVEDRKLKVTAHTKLEPTKVLNKLECQPEFNKKKHNKDEGDVLHLRFF